MARGYTPLLDADEKLTIAELQAIQLKRLKHTLRHAYHNSSAYRAKFDAAGVQPSDLKTLSDLSLFPFTTKEDLRQSYPFNFFAKPMDEVVRIHASSGTTGQATVVGYTIEDIDMWADVVARSIRAAGGRPGMKCHIACRKIGLHSHSDVWRTNGKTSPPHPRFQT